MTCAPGLVAWQQPPWYNPGDGEAVRWGRSRSRFRAVQKDRDRDRRCPQSRTREAAQAPPQEKALFLGQVTGGYRTYVRTTMVACCVGVSSPLMAELTQAEADALFQMEKFCRAVGEFDFPPSGKKLQIPLASDNDDEEFTLDINRVSFKISQVTFQNRTRTVIVLARLDIDGPPHTNPDGQELLCPHLHLYTAGCGTKWARPLPSGVFSDITNVRTTCDEFMKYVNVVQPPLFKPSLEI